MEIADCVAWYRETENLLIADAHEGNVIRTPDGVLFAIDPNLIQPCGEMLETVISLLLILSPTGFKAAHYLAHHLSLGTHYSLLTVSLTPNDQP